MAWRHKNHADISWHIETAWAIFKRQQITKPVYDWQNVFACEQSKLQLRSEMLWEDPLSQRSTLSTTTVRRDLCRSGRRRTRLLLPELWRLLDLDNICFSCSVFKKKNKQNKFSSGRWGGSVGEGACLQASWPGFSDWSHMVGVNRFWQVVFWPLRGTCTHTPSPTYHPHTHNSLTYTQNK